MIITKNLAIIIFNNKSRLQYVIIFNIKKHQIICQSLHLLVRINKIKKHILINKRIDEHNLHFQYYIVYTYIQITI